MLTVHRRPNNPKRKSKTRNRCKCRYSTRRTRPELIGPLIKTRTPQLQHRSIRFCRPFEVARDQSESQPPFGRQRSMSLVHSLQKKSLSTIQQRDKNRSLTRNNDTAIGHIHFFPQNHFDLWPSGPRKLCHNVNVSHLLFAEFKLRFLHRFAHQGLHAGRLRDKRDHRHSLGLSGSCHIIPVSRRIPSNRRRRPLHGRSNR